MKKILLSIAFLAFSMPVLAKGNYCLAHIKDHIYEYNTGHYELDVTNCQLQDTDLVTISNIIKSHPGMDMLTFDKNNIGEKGIQGLNGIDHAIDISIDDNHIGDNGVKLLLAKATHLYQLSVNRNKITNQSIPGLAQSDIKWLHLAGNQITDVGPLANKEKLNLSYNPLSTEGLLKVAQSESIDTLYIAGIHLDQTVLKALNLNQWIEDLDVSHTDLGDTGIQMISDNLGLVILNVGDDKITDAGIQQGIAKLRGLRYLYLDGNNITAAGIKALPSDRLEALDLSNNHLGDKGILGLVANAKFLYLALDNNQIQSKDTISYIVNNFSSLSILSINENNLGVEGVKELVKHSFGGIYIDNNHIGNEGAMLLARNVMRTLSIANNEIDDQGVLKFEPLLSKDLFYLDVRKNHIGTAGIQALKNHQPAINHLYIDDSFSNKNEKNKVLNMMKMKRFCSLHRDDAICKMMVDLSR